jgi:NAD+ synthase (glutamine-hydrolysing)/outer membrane lipoprotein carrier protein
LAAISNQPRNKLRYNLFLFIVRVFMKRKIIIALGLLSLAQFSSAAAVEQLKLFVSNTKTLSANFSQQVTTQKGKTENATGLFSLLRPGLFRWQYQTPYDQEIIGDGKTIWVYDKELAQVTKRTQNATLGSSPAALLAGDNTLEKNYKLKELPKTGTTEWLLATPKTPDNTFKEVKIGLSNNELTEMILKDNFGNTTRIRFNALVKNPPLTAASFQFTPPKNVDVLSE